MRQPDRALEQLQREYYVATASRYDEMHVRPDDEHSLALAHTIHFMHQQGIRRVLDVGCGTGRAIAAFKAAGFSVTGIDPVHELLSQCLAHGLDKENLVQGSGSTLPFPDESFDAVCAFGVLHHVQRPKGIVSEMLRVSRKSIFLSDTNRFGRAGLATRLVKLALWKCGLWPLAYHLWTRGTGCDISDCDGIAYSYSVYDSLDQIASWADSVTLLPTKTEGPRVRSWLTPLLTSSHVLLAAQRH